MREIPARGPGLVPAQALEWGLYAPSDDPYHPAEPRTLHPEIGMNLATRPLCLGLALLAFSACETVTGVAPKGTPRVEIELAVDIDSDFYDALVDVDQSSDLDAAVREAVRSKADLGLRFYPTPSESYGKKDQRPPYLMTVDIDSLEVALDHETIEEEGKEPVTKTSVAKVSVAVSASIEHRRVTGPPLVVATSSATSVVKAEQNAEKSASGMGYEPSHDGAGVKVLKKDILRAVQSATDRALKEMRTPIDREFSPEEDSDSAPAEQG